MNTQPIRYEEPSIGLDRLTKYDVVIIGAGMGGLSAANAFREKDPSLNVLVVEASSHVGGRIRTSSTFGGSSTSFVELGAEIVHGEHTALFKLCKDNNLPTSLVYTWAQGDCGPSPDHPVNGGVGYYYFGSERIFLPYNSTEPDFMHLHDVISSIDELNKEERDHYKNKSMMDYLRDHGITPRMIRLAEAGYANTLCGNLREAPVTEVIAVEEAWADDGLEQHRVVEGGLSRIIASLQDGIHVWRDWPVTRVEWKDTALQPGVGAARIFNKSGEMVEAKRVVVAVPVTVLQEDDISFFPPLPWRKRDAIRRIKMEPCVKIFLRFKKRVWPEDMHGLICEASTFPEFWPAVSTKDPTLVAYCTADYARHVQAMTRAQVIETVLSQLNEMFGTKEDPKPASDNYMSILIQDWTKEPFIRGGYTRSSRSTLADTGVSDRLIARRPVEDKIFFAGEAFSECHSTIHAAMDTGAEAAEAVIASLSNEKKGQEPLQSKL